jgi:membrane protein DedA with SNARE-associated domain
MELNGNLYSFIYCLAETGLLQVSLPGDSLLFLAGIYNRFN